MERPKATRTHGAAPGDAQRGTPDAEGQISESHRLEGAARTGRWLVTCDHACNRVPESEGGSLGLPEAEMARHIAWDPGAAGVACALGELLQAPVLLSRFSRLVIDPNRGEDDPTLIMRLYDGTIIPGNRHLGPADITRRLERLYRPYHAAYAGLAARRSDCVICAVHSFTPCLRGRAPRPWQVGVLHAPADSRLALPLLAGLRALGLEVGDNQPYSGHLPGDSIDRHALRKGRLNALIELRQDLIATAEAQQDWARWLAPVLRDALAEADAAA